MKKKQSLTLIAYLLLTVSTAFAQNISVSGASGADGIYNTLGSAFTAINNANQAGNNIVIQVTGNTTETAIASLNQGNWTSLKILPTVTASISGNLNSALIQLNGADNVIIEGRIGESGSTNALTISNTSTGTAASSIAFTNSATNNIVRYSNITGTGTGTTSGTVSFTSTSGTGNDNNTLTYCNITGRATYAVYSSGSSSAVSNDNVTISHNNIYDNFRTNAVSTAILVTNHNNHWTIEGNSFFETTNFVSTVSGQAFYRHINIDLPSSGAGMKVLNNYIGGSAPQCAGTPMTISHSTATGDIRLRIIASRAANTLIEGNTIANIHHSSGSNYAFMAVNTIYGTTNIIKNSIYSIIIDDKIQLNRPSNTYFIYVQNDAVSVNITDNSIKDIHLKGEPQNLAVINLSSSIKTSTVNVSGNTIGEMGKPNSILVEVTTTTQASVDMSGIIDNSRARVTIERNVIANMNNRNTYFISNQLEFNNAAIYANISNEVTIKENVISHFESANNNTMGIYVAGNNPVYMERNYVMHVKNSGAVSTNQYYASGIYLSSSSDDNDILRNFIFGTQMTGTNPANRIVGLLVNSGKYDIQNNIISLGTIPDGNRAEIFGIKFENGANISSYHNTVYIGGAAATGAGASYARYTGGNLGNQSVSINNIFYNERTGGTGNYSIDAAHIPTYSVITPPPIPQPSVTTNKYGMNPLFANPGGDLPEDYVPKVSPTSITGDAAVMTLIRHDFGTDNIRKLPVMGAWEVLILNYWKGGVSTDWADANNWSGGRVPLEIENVEFATEQNNATSGPAINNLILDRNRSVRSLINHSDKKLIIPSVAGGRSLLVNELILTNNNHNQILIQASESAPNGSLIFARPALNREVGATIEMYSKAYRGTPATVNGNTYSYRWQFFGVPVKTLTPFPTFDGSWVRVYDETINIQYGKWTYLNNASIMEPWKGYEITHETKRKFSVQGTLVTDSVVIPLGVTHGIYAAGQHVLSNPYTAAIDIHKMIFDANTEKTVYLYNTGSFAQWYNAINFGSDEGQYLAIPQNTAAIVAQEIPSMQGFVVKTLGTTPGSLIVNYSVANGDQIRNTTPQRAKAETGSKSNTEDFSYLKIDVQGDNFIDNVWLIKEEGTSTAFDNGWDGYKMIGALGAPQLFAWEDSGIYQVNTVDDVDGTYFGFRAGLDTEYIISIKANNILDQYSNLCLKDLSTGAITSFTNDSLSYTFTASNTQNPEKRFRLVSGVPTIDQHDNLTEINISAENKTVKISNPANKEGRIRVFDATGKVIYSKPLSSQSYSTFDLDLVSGSYLLINIETTKGEIYTERVILR